MSQSQGPSRAPLGRHPTRIGRQMVLTSGQDESQHLQSLEARPEASTAMPELYSRKRKRQGPLPAQNSPAAIAQRSGSIWTFYEKRFLHDLDGSVTVVEKKDGTPGLWAVRTVPRQNADHQIRLLSQLQNPSLFVNVLEIFVSGSMMHIVREHMDITLSHILAAPMFLQEVHVAAIAGKERLLRAHSRRWITSTDCSRSQIPPPTPAGTW